MTLKWRQLFLGKIIPLSELTALHKIQPSSEFGIISPARNSCRHFSGIWNPERENYER